MIDETFLMKCFSDEVAAIPTVNMLGSVLGVLLTLGLVTGDHLAWAGQPDNGAAAVAQGAGSSNDSTVPDAKVDALIKQLSEGEALQARRELGSTKGPKVVDQLIKELDSSRDESVRAALIDALGDVGDPRAVEILVRMLEDQAGSQPVPDNPVHIEDGVGVISFEEISGGKAAMRRQGAAQALGKIKDERAVEPLVKVLDDENDILALEAVKALAAIKSARAVESLLGEVQNPKDMVRLQVMVSLGAIQDERALLPLIKVFEEDQNKYIRDQAFNALNKFSFESQPALAARLGEDMVKLYQGGDVRDRILAVWFLGKLKVPSALKVFLEAASGPEAQLREAAAEGLGNLGGQKALATLEKLAGDTDELVRQAAKKALANLRAGR